MEKEDAPYARPCPVPSSLRQAEDAKWIPVGKEIENSEGPISRGRRRDTGPQGGGGGGERKTFGDRPARGGHP